MAQSEVFVVWDGRREGPGSAYLVAEPERPSTLIARVPLTERVAVLLRRQPMTLKQMAEALSLSPGTVHVALWHLREAGRAAQVGTTPTNGRHFGRRFEHVYGLVEGA